MEPQNLVAPIPMGNMDIHLNKDRISNMLTIASQFVNAGCFTKDVANVYQAFTKIQAGAEMGMPPMEAMTSLYIVNGNVTMWGKALTTRLRKFGWAIKYEDSKDDQCTATITKGEEIYSYTSTKTELESLKSRAAVFALKDKLKWHAISRICRFYVPEVLGSISYVTEEIEGLPNNFGSSSQPTPSLEGSKLSALKTEAIEVQKEKEPAIEAEIVLGKLKKKEEPAPVAKPSAMASFYQDEPMDGAVQAAQEVFGTQSDPAATAVVAPPKPTEREKKEIELVNALEKNPNYNFDRALKAFNVSDHTGLTESQIDICIQAVKKNKQF